MRRHRINKNSSKRYFSNAANIIHRKNLMPSTSPMRGGIRL